MENDSKIKLNALTRKAEDAIRFFKNMAIKQVGQENVPDFKSEKFEEELKLGSKYDSGHMMDRGVDRHSRFSHHSASKSSLLGDYRSKSVNFNLTR